MLLLNVNIKILPFCKISEIDHNYIQRFKNKFEYFKNPNRSR